MFNLNESNFRVGIGEIIHCAVNITFLPIFAWFFILPLLFELLFSKRFVGGLMSYLCNLCLFVHSRLFDFFVLNATFSNILAISWRSVLVVEEAGVPGENHRQWASNWLTLSLAAASRVHPFL
jgi:hypothetical protein